jgi:hypothetical protein
VLGMMDRRGCCSPDNKAVKNTSTRLPRRANKTGKTASAKALRRGQAGSSRSMEETRVLK